MPETVIPPPDPVRPLRRVEFMHLADQGFFGEERVELLFGMVVPVTPPKPAHGESTYRVRRALEAALGDRARVRDNAAFAASDISQPLPDIAVVPPIAYWDEHPTRAFLVIGKRPDRKRPDRGKLHRDPDVLPKN